MYWNRNLRIMAAKIALGWTLFGLCCVAMTALVGVLLWFTATVGPELLGLLPAIAKDLFHLLRTGSLPED
jgi:hypothetical protein